ncbi:MAG: OmpH family outer membrane protein [Planctomycetes bacterium]|nr:OmpH family outer membrane protein [Planctomycetota bacterium]
MKKTVGIAILMVGLVALLVGANGGKPEPSRVAVCDLAKVVDDYKRVQSLQDDLAQQEKSRVEEVKRRSDVIEMMAKQMDDLKEGSEDRKKLEETAWEKMYELKAYRETEQGRLQRKSRDGLLSCYEEIMAQISRHAESNGIDLVVYKEQLDPLLKTAQNTQELKSMINSRRVLYNSAALDITDAVIAALNAKWTMEHPEAAPKP